jgi:hypothetical protein
VKSFVVNTHHSSGHFETLFANGRYRQLRIRLIHEPVLLETGGGIKNAQPWLGTEPFIAYSGDVLTDLPLEPLLHAHFSSGNDVTLALRETGLASNVAFRDSDGRVIDIGNRYGHPGNFDYANVSVWNPQIFERIPQARKSPLFRSSPNGSALAAGSVASFRRKAAGGISARAPSISRSIARSAKETWRPDYVQPSAWPIGSRPTRASIRARKCAVALRLAPAVASVPARSSRTRSFGPAHKLPPIPG